MTFRVLTLHSRLERTRATPSNLVSAFTNAILDIASPEVLFQLATAHGYFYQEIRQYWRAKYSHERYLEPFIPVQHLPTFWNVLAEHDALISGSVALQYFSRRLFEDSDLDIYCPEDGAEGLENFLKSIGYTRSQDPDTSSSSTTDYSHSPSVFQVLNFTGNPEPASETKRRIQMIVTDKNPLDTVLCFHSTVVMNIITPHISICFYPHETLHLKEGVALQSERSDRGSVQQAFSKYRSRGWNITDEPSIRSMFHADCGLVQDRSLADGRTLMLPGPIGSEPFRHRDSGWLAKFRVTTSTSWSHWMSHNNRVYVVFEFGTHCTSPRGHCFSRPASTLHIHGYIPPGTTSPRCMDYGCTGTALWEDTRIVTAPATDEHRHLLDCGLANYIRHEFGKRYPASGLTAYRLLTNLFPLFRCFRFHPKLVLVFPRDESSILVKAVFIYESRHIADCETWHAVVGLQNFETISISEFAFEVIWADDNAHFLTETSVPFPAEASGPYQQRPFMNQIEAFGRSIADQINAAVRTRHEEGCSSQPRSTCNPKWDDRGKAFVCRYIQNIFKVLDLPSVSMEVIHDRHSKALGGKEVLTVIVHVPDDWPHLESTMLTMAPNRAMQIRLLQHGFTVTLMSSYSQWL
ncbi:hypothetical protein V5O48_004601 [Marasmius crinis-equi]|uniref:Uncharacterized protein n=1 Tax=Marasmius crinis-equi TaxID=585013 RepID=A0ABR3FPP0_9AGAR